MLKLVVATVQFSEATLDGGEVQPLFTYGRLSYSVGGWKGNRGNCLLSATNNTACGSTAQFIL